jgi:hypothetical protein
VAAAVTSGLSAQLGGRRLTPQHLWLAQPPPTIHAGVWEAVCLAAVAAMDGGRRQMTARQLATPATAAGPELAAAASRHAVARLWDLLQDFAVLVPPPPVGAGRCPLTTLSCGGSPAPSAGCSFALPELVVVGGTRPPQH